MLIGIYSSVVLQQAKSYKTLLKCGYKVSLKLDKAKTLYFKTFKHENTLI